MVAERLVFTLGCLVIKSGRCGVVDTVTPPEVSDVAGNRGGWFASPRSSGHTLAGNSDSRVLFW